MFAQLGHLPRFIRLTLIITFVIVIPTLYFLYPTPERLPSKGEFQSGGIDSEHWRNPIKPDYFQKEEVREYDDDNDDSSINQNNQNYNGISDKTLNGGVIMPKLGNETAKAELGRSAWKVLHLMTLRYPDEPTEDDRQALKSYFHLFSRLYPCGECATEFQALLKKYPPQTSSRKSASLWLCHVHNLVNERLGKPEFDCLTLDETYDCGCGDESSTATDDTTTKTKINDAEETSREDEREIREELVLGHGGGEFHLNPNHKIKINDENDKKGIKWVEEGNKHGDVGEERPIHNIPKRPIKPAYDEDQSTALLWEEEQQGKDVLSDNSVQKGDELEREYDNERTKFEDEQDELEKQHRHDGSKIKSSDDKFQWEE